MSMPRPKGTIAPAARSHWWGRKERSMSTERAEPYDAPAGMVDAIFGESTEAGDAAGEKRITAQLDDVEEGLRLTIVHEDGAFQPAPVMVADLAAADREINSFLERHPGHAVLRAGDGWATHPE